MRTSKRIITVAVIAALAITTWIARDNLPWVEEPYQSRKDKNFGQRAILVEAAKARKGSVTVIIEALGTAQANEAVTITSKVTGLVSKISFSEGGQVKTGDVLVELDSQEMQASLEEKKAELVNATRLYERARELYERRSVPRAQMDDRFGDLQAVKARVRVEKARIKEYYIRAPFSGRLGLRRVSVGTLIDPGMEITTLDDTGKIKADFRVPETALSHIATGQSVTVKSGAYTDLEFKGNVTTIDTRVDPVTRSVQVRVILNNPDELIRPGMFMTAEFVAIIREDSVLIPEQAIVVSRDRQYVFVIDNDKASRRNVVIGEHVNGEIEILSGLVAEELVIVGGVQKIREGTTIKLAKPPQSKAQ